VSGNLLDAFEPAVLRDVRERSTLVAIGYDGVLVDAQELPRHRLELLSRAADRCLIVCERDPVRVRQSLVAVRGVQVIAVPNGSGPTAETTIGWAEHLERRSPWRTGAP